MNINIITFETAKLAKIKGFDISSNNYYLYNGELQEIELFSNYKQLNKFIYKTGFYNLPKHIWNNEHEWAYFAPTQALLQKWLREKYNIHIDIHIENFSDTYIWSYEILYINEDCSNKTTDGEFKTYESAIEQGLITALNLIK